MPRPSRPYPLDRGLLAATVLLFGASLAVKAAHAQATTAPALVRGLTQPQDDYPAYSPDGRWIVFQSNRSGSWQLWLMQSDGTGLRRLTHGGANDRTPHWSPDGSRIVFSSDRLQARGQTHARPRRNIHVIDVRTGFDSLDQRTSLLLAHEGEDIHPRWSDDGNTIVFNRVSPTGERDGATVMMMDADGRDVRAIPLPAGINTYASLTRAGRVIYRGTTRETQDGRTVDNSDIFSAAADGSDRQRLTDDPEFDGWPAVSPDGRTIAFASRRSGGHYQVFVMPVGGGSPRAVTSGAYDHTQPAWSPDGRQLAMYRWTRDQAGEVGHVVTFQLSP